MTSLSLLTFVSRRSAGSGSPRMLGFTLIELMIVVAIVAILAAIAYPGYQSQVRASRRSDAISEMSRVQQAQERWRSNRATYSGDVSSSVEGLRLIADTTAVDNYDTPSGYYNIAVSGNTASAHVVTASAKAGTSQTKDTNCQCMRVRWTGGNAIYEAANSTSGSCAGAAWATTNAAACWKR